MCGAVLSRARTVEISPKVHALEKQVLCRAPETTPGDSGQNRGAWSCHGCRRRQDLAYASIVHGWTGQCRESQPGEPCSR